MTIRTAFDRLYPEMSGEHPIDKAMSERFARSPLLGRIRREMEELEAALGEKKRVWLALEASWQEYLTRRQEAYFNEGYAHGLAAGKAFALQRLRKGRPSETYLRLTEMLRALVLLCSLPAAECLRALLETAWSLSRGDEGGSRV